MVIGNNSIQVYDSSTTSDRAINSRVTCYETAGAETRAYVIKNARMVKQDGTLGDSASEQTVGWALANRPNSSASFVNLAAENVDEPLIFKPAGPNFFDLTCKADRGVASMEVSYTHEDVEGGATQNPTISDGKYSIPEEAEVTVTPTLSNDASFQTWTGLPDGAKVDETTHAVTFTMPSEAKTIAAYCYSGVSAKGSAVVQKSATLDPCAATVTLTGNTSERSVTLVRDGEEPLLLTKDGESVTDYKANLPQNSKEYKVYVDGADSGQTITLNSTSASATVAYQTYTITATKDGEADYNPGTIQLKAGDIFVTNGSSLPSGSYNIYLNGEKVSNTTALSDSTLKFYTVTFNNGANENAADYGENTNFYPQVVLSGKTAAEPEVAPDAPEGMEGKLFAGWTKGSEAFDFDTAITGTTTLIAKWITEEELAADPDIEAKWTIDGESAYGLLSDALAATKTAGRGQILLLKDSVALKAESENELAANVTLTVPEGKEITNEQTLTAKGTISNKGTISCKVTNSGAITNSGSLASVTNLSGAKITNTGTIASASNAGSMTGGVITTASNTGTIKGAKVGISSSTGTLDGCTITGGTNIAGTIKGYTYAADSVTFASNARTQGTINIGGSTTYNTLKTAVDAKNLLKVNLITRSTLTESGTLDLDGHSIKGADGKSGAKNGVTPLTAGADLTVTGTGSVTGGTGYSDEVAGNGGHGIAGNTYNIVIDSYVTVTGGIGGAGVSGSAIGGQGGCGVHMGTHGTNTSSVTATIAGTVVGGRGGAAVEGGTCGNGGYGVCGSVVDNGGTFEPGKGGDGRTSDPTNNTLTPPSNGADGKSTEHPVMYGVMYDLTDLEVSGDKPDKVALDAPLSVQLRLKAGANPYLVTPNAITVTMKGQLLGEDKYTYNKETGTVSIPNVRGAVTITAKAEPLSEVKVDTEDELRKALEARVPKIIVTESFALAQTGDDGKPLALLIPEGITVSINEGKVIDLAACPFIKQGTVTGAGKVARTLKGKLIDKDSNPVIDATVKLMLGATELNVTATTDSNGKYSFANLDQGTYNLVFEKTDDTTEIKAVDMMILPIETENKVDMRTTKLTAENCKTIVEVKREVPVSEVAVGGLNEQFANTVSDNEPNKGITDSDLTGGKTVELKLTVDKVPLANEAQITEIKQMMKNDEEDSGKKLIPIDISVTKTVTSGNDSTVIPLVETKALITVVIPLKGELAGKSGYVLYRYHKDETTVSVVKIGNTANLDGEYIKVDTAGGYITAHLKKFSTYGIGYTPQSSGSEGGSSSGGGTSEAIPVQKIELSTSTKTLTKKGETTQLTAVITPLNATDKKLTWSSSDNSVATVDENGKVTAVSDGTVTITAKSHNGVTAEITIVVKLEKEQEKEEDTEKDKTDTTDITPDNTFRKLRLRSSKVSRNSSTLVWNKVKEADGYVLYGAQCNANGKVYKIKKLATIKDNSAITYKAKGLKSGTYYKYCVAAYKLVDGRQVITAKSKVIHVATSSGKYGNYKAVKVNKAKVELKAGKTYTIKATQVQGEKPVKKHADIRFETSNSKIATITKNGVITAKRKGTCTIYVYAQNGIYKTVKVTVK